MEDPKKHLEECRRLFDSLPDPGGLLDPRGNFIIVTKAFEDLVGRKKSDLIGTNAFTAGFFNKDFEKVAFGNMKKWLENKTVLPHDIELNVKNGAKIIARTRYSVVNYHGKKAFLFILFDVTEQRKAENKLIESEKKMRDILASTTDIAWEVDEKGHIIYISGKVKEILGYEPQDLIGKSIYNVMSPREKAKIKKTFHSALLKKEIISDYETVVLTKKGEERIFLTNGIPVLGLNDKLIGYRGVEKDITDRKRNEEKFQELFDNMKSGVAVYKFSEKENDFIIKDFNRAAEKIEGVKKETLIGKKLLKISPELKKNGVYDNYLKVWKSGVSEYFSVVLGKNTNKESWRDVFVYRLSSDEVVIIFDDVTENVKSDKKIEESEAKFRKIFEASPEAIVILDNKATVVDLNGRVVDWLGYTVKEIIGKNLLEFPFFSDKSKMRVMGKYKERMAKKSIEIPPYELEFIGKSGKVFVGRIYTRLIQSDVKGNTQDLVMISDVTDEKESEKSRSERQEQLEKMNNLMVGRELKMIELKERIKKLEEKK